MRTNEKKGISLIVLVLTIIVMIILATAIILSVSNSGIIGKANEAKQDSDTANLKEYANVLVAEWELMDTSERATINCSSSVEYVNTKLNEKGYTNKTYSVDGEIYTGANEIAKDALLKGLKIGDEVKYPVTANKYTPDSSKTGTTNSELTAQTNLKWIYVGVSEEGELLITPDVSSGVPANSDVELYGKQGWLTGPDELNTICDKLYTVTGKGNASSMDIDDVTRILGYTGEKGSYYDGRYIYVPTTEAKKIGAIEKELNKTLSDRYTPKSGKKLEDYYSDSYSINKTKDVKEIKNSKYVNLIYPSSGTYWLASSCVYASFGYDAAGFRIRLVDSSDVSTYGLFDSHNNVARITDAVRPVVSLTSKIQKHTTTGSDVVWEFAS